MLTDNIVKQAIPLASTMTEAGLKATAYEGSELALLIHRQRARTNLSTVYYATHPDEIASYDLETRYNTHAGNLVGPVALTTSNLEQTEQEALAVMDYFADEIGKKVNNHLNVARNVVKPAILDLVDRINSVLESVTAESIMDVEIIEFEIPESFNDIRFTGPLGKYDDKDYELYIGSVGLPQIQWNELIEYLKTGIDSVDEANIAFISTAGKERIMEMYNNVFGQDVSGRTNDKTFPSYVRDPVWSTHYTMAMYLLADKFHDEPLEGTVATLSQYNATLVKLREIAGAHLKRQINIHLQNQEDKQLVRSFTNRSVEVYSDIYAKYVEEGGKPEALLGLIFSGDKNYTYDTILGRTEELVSVWNMKSASLKHTEKARRNNYIYRAALECFISQMREDAGEDEGLSANIVQIAEQGRKVLDEMTSAELSDIVEVSIRLNCRARFARTASEEFIRSINETLTDSPQCSPEEAEQIAMVQYVTRWIASMIGIKSFQR